MEIKPNECHEILKNEIKQKLAFNENCNYEEWKDEVRQKFNELLCIDSIKDNACPLNFEIESIERLDGYKRIRFTFESEIGAVVPCYILIPELNQEKYPVVITLQGHSSGFHNSVGIAKFPNDANYIATRGDYATQAVKQGYIGVAIEMRAMGERRATGYNRDGAHNCEYEAHVAMMLGRTLLGERAWDISRLIDVLENFKECDLDKIAITGSSGGGTASYYSACYDERIKIVVPDCSFCGYKDSIMNVMHCSCNYIPRAYEWFEMEDLSCLIAPRNLVCIGGSLDTIFPMVGVRKSFKTVQAIYAKANATGNCRVMFTPSGHCWRKDLTWSAIREEMIKLGWIK